MSKHQKRISASISWPITKKTHKWVVGANAGAHSKDTGLPLLIVVRDMLKLANNGREAKKIINNGDVCVDGVPRKDYKYITGLFDIISIPLLDKYYRMILDEKKKFKLYEVGKDAPKLCRINNKTIIKNGAVQLNLHDGNNIIADNNCKTFDTILLSVPDKKLSKHIQYKVGNLAMVVGGEHSGEIGKINEIRKVRGSGTNMVTILGNKEFQTIEDYVFVIGESTPEIKVV